MSSIVLAFLSVIALSLESIVWKYSIDKGSCPIATLVLYHILAVFLLLPFTGIPIPHDINISVWVLLFLSCAVWVIGDYFSVKAYEYLDASVCSIYGMMTLVLVTTAGIFIFGESLSVISVVGIIMIIIAVVFQLNFKNLIWNQGSVYKLTAIFFHTLALIIDAYLVSQVSEKVIVFYGFLLPAIIYILFGFKKLSNLPFIFKETQGVFLLAPVLGVAYYYFFILAISQGSLAITYAIQETSVIFILLFEVALFKVSCDFYRKAVSCGVCALGAILVCGVI